MPHSILSKVIKICECEAQRGNMHGRRYISLSKLYRFALNLPKKKNNE